MDTSSIERNFIESDMRTLATEIKSQRERGEMKDANGREVLKEALRVFPNFEKKPSGPDLPTLPTPQSAPPGGSVTSPLPAYAQTAPAEVKLEIEYLIDLALRKGISAAFREAGKSSAFVQDAFHDALTGRLYPDLKKEGIVD